MTYAAPIEVVSANLTPIHLVGALGDAVGRNKWDLDVGSPAEAIRAINIITRGALERYLRGPGKDEMYQIALQEPDKVIGVEEAPNRSGRSAIYFMPAIEGRNSGFGKILAGAALIGLAFLAPGSAFIVGKSLTALGAVTVGFGTSLVLGGITQLITPTPKGFTATESDTRSSTSFQGNATAVVQGGCVPVVYGRMLVSPVPISITIENNDVPITEAGTVGTVDTTDLSGGGTQYTPGISEAI